tara:strand:- start:23426 stop:23893 length:468 start_codon:yes stop_codon:yes gene_type:complete
MSSVFKNTGTSSAALPPAGKGARARRNKKATTKQPSAKQADELSAISDQLATIGESLQGFSAKVDEFDKGVTKYSQEKDQMKKDVSAMQDPVEAMLAELKSRRADNVAYGNLAAQIDKIKDDYPDETLIRAMRSGMEQISAMTMEDLRQIDAMSK